MLARGALRWHSDNTKGCYDVINNAKPIMVEACKAVLEARAKRGAKAAKEPFVVADYGAADGACAVTVRGRQMLWALPPTQAFLSCIYFTLTIYIDIHRQIDR